MREGWRGRTGGQSRHLDDTDQPLRLFPEPDTFARALRSMRHQIYVVTITFFVFAGYSDIFKDGINEHVSFVLPKNCRVTRTG